MDKGVDVWNNADVKVPWMESEGNNDGNVHPVEHRIASTRPSRVFEGPISTVASTPSNTEKLVERQFHQTAVNQTTSTPRFAQAFVIGGCMPENPAYLGFLYDVWISARILQQVQSKVEVVVFVQLSPDSSHNKLPDNEEAITQALGIRLIYLDKNPHASFYEITLDKFRVVNLTEYDRVLFTDSDVLPLGNLDYIFELSMKGELQETFVIAGRQEPANGGFFMVTPQAGDWERLQGIVRQREIASAHIDNKEKFDKVQGWGHTILPPDYWENAYGTKMTNWTFHAAWGMQGLLYYWVKYTKRNVSIHFGNNRIQHWAAGPNSTAYLVNTTKNLFQPYSKPIFHEREWCVKWMCDFAHFSSAKKPWLKPPPANLTHMTEPTNAFDLWFVTLRQLNKQFAIGIDFENWNVGKPPLGAWPMLGSVGKKAERTLDGLKEQNQTTVA